MLWVTVAIGVFGLVMAPMFVAGTTGAVLMMALGLSLMGLTYGPLGTVLSELFPTRVRYTGSSLAFSFAGILGASLAPYIATWLAKTYGLQYVGYYLSAAAVLTLAGAAFDPRNERRRSRYLNILVQDGETRCQNWPGPAFRSKKSSCNEFDRLDCKARLQEPLRGIPRSHP